MRKGATAGMLAQIIRYKLCRVGRFNKLSIIYKIYAQQTERGFNEREIKIMLRQCKRNLAVDREAVATVNGSDLPIVS